LTTRERSRKPQLERTQPLRSWSGIYGGAGERSDSEGAPGAASSYDGAVTRAVDLGYRVVDEYIHQGQKAAQRMRDRAYEPETVQADIEEVGMRVAQYASDFASLFSEVLEARGSSESEASAEPVHSAPKSSDDEAAVPNAPSEPIPSRPVLARARMQVSSRRPAEVTLDLREEAAEHELVVHDLRAVDPDTPRISGVTLDAGTSATLPVLKVRIEDDQPGGIYSGLIVNPLTSLPVGSVTIQIVDDPRSP
jgi:hypothetical protein